MLSTEVIEYKTNPRPSTVKLKLLVEDHEATGSNLLNPSFSVEYLASRKGRHVLHLHFKPKAFRVTGYDRV